MSRTAVAWCVSSSLLLGAGALTADTGPRPTYECGPDPTCVAADPCPPNICIYGGN